MCVDHIYENISIEKEIKKDNAIIDQTLLMFAIIKKFERVGDLIKNIAEEIKKVDGSGEPAKVEAS